LTTAVAVSPARRARGSSKIRWSSTACATAFTSSGTMKRLPSASACACAARARAEGHLLALARRFREARDVAAQALLDGDVLHGLLERGEILARRDRA